MKKLYHFLGGIYFAIFLIASIACFVIAGTVLESVTESHRYASLFTYENPIFTGLLSCLFINILFSATRRYPFKLKHIPFLTTHLGLLMILTGVFIKSAYGTQGSLFVLEGSHSDEIVLANRYEIQMESRHEKTKFSLEAPTPLDNVKVKTIAYTPHSQSGYETAIKNNFLHVVGLTPLSLGKRVPIAHFSSKWDVLGLESDQPMEEAKRVYLEHLHVKLSKNDHILFMGKPNSPRLDIEKRLLIFLYAGKEITVSLDSLKSDLPYTVDLIQKPLLLLINSNPLHFFAFDAHGRIHNQIIEHDTINSYIAYDSGFGGYTFPITFPYQTQSRLEQQQTAAQLLKQNLRESLKSDRQLSPPLFFLKQVCDQNSLDFPETCIDFLVGWHNSGQLIFENDLITSDAKHLISDKELQACHWISLLLMQIEPRLAKGEQLFEILKDLEWPLLENLKTEAEPLQALIHQIYAISDELPNPKKIHFSGLLSAYLRLYGITWDSVSSMIDPSKAEELTLEFPLSLKHVKKEQGSKLEENVPTATLLLDDAGYKESLTLSYQKNGGGLKWPALRGHYLFRFQPKTLTIPFLIRLRNARQINYPGTEQAYSYESDLIITDKRDGSVEEKTISMNRVHETWDGYRFYLSNMSPGDDSDIHRIQIAVNHDPAKYWVTYPGAAIASMGILLLFWMRPYGKK